MVDVDGAPVIERLVERMAVAGCRAIRVVTRPDKDDVREYAKSHGLEVVLAHPAHIGESVAHALAGVDDEVVALGFPDSIWEPIDGFALLRDALDPPIDVVLGLFDYFDPERADVVALDEMGRVRDIVVKPANPQSTLIWGCLVAHADALRHIERSEWPSDHVRPLIASGRVAGLYLSDRYVDIGTPEGLAHARSSAGA
jgi:NDP-sugar pyrophosphorylase family protein